jgi:hypothetical protein
MGRACPSRLAQCLVSDLRQPQDHVGAALARSGAEPRSLQRSMTTAMSIASSSCSIHWPLVLGEQDLGHEAQTLGGKRGRVESNRSCGASIDCANLFHELSFHP